MVKHKLQRETNIKEKVLEKISTNELTMRPKSFFVFKATALIALAIAVLTISIFVCDFILLSLRINGHYSLLGFGSRGMWMFLTFFPWGLLLFDGFLVFLLERLLRQFRFGYRTPVLLLLLGLLIVTLSIGFFIDRSTDLNEQLLLRARKHQLMSPLDTYYDRAVHPSLEEGICRCVITSIQGDSLTAYDESLGAAKAYTITIPPNENSNAGLKVGDVVYIAGDHDEHGFRAFGIQKLDITPRK